MLFPKATFFFLCIVAFLGVSSIYFLVRINPSDLDQYRSLSAETHDLRSQKTLERHPALQQREMVDKEIWTMQGNQRDHLQILSDTSEFSVLQKKGSLEAVENLTHLSCFYGGTLHAETGCFRFPEQSLQAGNLEYAHPQGTLKAGEGLLIKGLDLFLNESVQMISDKNEMTIQSKRAICRIEDQKVEFFEGVKIEYQDKYFVQSNHSTLYHGKNQIEAIEMDESVRLYSPKIDRKESFALADHVVLYPDKKTVSLIADTPNRVLFWQDGLTLSAPEIFIEQDRIEGIGDVHCTFTVEEQNSIDQFISTYL